MDDLGFPFWLRATHFINLFCMFLLIRSGIQILADHPKLYWNDDARPGSEWIKFGKKIMPKDRLWTSMDEAETVNSIIALPGGHHNLGAGRRWHFLTILVWVINGLVYVSLLFATGQWRRLIPTSWDILPAALDSAVTYATFHIPPETAFHPYDPLQQLTYAAIVFLVAPMMILTGLCMSPAFIARFPWYPTLFGGRQVARSLHFLGLVVLLSYIIVHVTLVLVVHFFNNIGNMVFGDPHFYPEIAAAIAALGLVGVLVFHIVATRWTLGHQRTFQVMGDRILEPVLRFLFGRLRSRQRYAVSAITPHFRVNGYPPVSSEYRDLADRGFDGWALKICGLVECPLSLSLDDLRQLPKQEQITKHNCIQGWSGVAEWGGVPMHAVMSRCHPLSRARYVAFHAFMQEEYAPNSYYEVLTLDEVLGPQTILAYEMNWKALPTEHGAPCRLRVETKTGYKMVKYLKVVEFIDDVGRVGQGYGGYREDHQFYDKVASI
ncbi:MAG TPA: molybdopterin-dependent oxidoreductase [Nitrospiraceae bacterium]|nr:molybdopterin-dependent oxidoreductase [Nitrospiraceae bacterium]